MMALFALHKAKPDDAGSGGDRADGVGFLRFKGWAMGLSFLGRTVNRFMRFQDALTLPGFWVLRRRRAGCPCSGHAVDPSLGARMPHTCGIRSGTGTPDPPRGE